MKSKCAKVLSHSVVTMMNFAKLIFFRTTCRISGCQILFASAYLNAWYQIFSGRTYTNHTRMSPLVPVIKMVLGVARYSLTFDIWGQTQLCKNEKGDKVKDGQSLGSSAKAQSNYREECCSSPPSGRDVRIHPLLGAEMYHGRSGLEEGPAASQSPPAVRTPAAIFSCCVRSRGEVVRPSPKCQWLHSGRIGSGGLSLSQTLFSFFYKYLFINKLRLIN